ncbi:twin-arginine translocase TatA/TatE family subunit [Streptomyces sp. NPDC102462]|uniref:twin-arginine translocase TatA/TatE family subunit n=1 Tax=Streptomyces sp. NPDC102462 TaxID=3366178 RepID=UPI00380437C7
MFGLSELAMILIVVIVVLGIKKLPELTRSAGKAARIFKSEAKALGGQDTPSGPPAAQDVVSGTVVNRDGSPRT